jgi:hypothetical protein
MPEMTTGGAAVASKPVEARRPKPVDKKGKEHASPPEVKTTPASPEVPVRENPFVLPQAPEQRAAPADTSAAEGSATQTTTAPAESPVTEGAAQTTSTEAPQAAVTDATADVSSDSSQETPSPEASASTPPVETTAASQDASAETAQTRETVSRETQAREVNLLSSALINRRGRELADMSEAQRRAAYATNPADRDIYALYGLQYQLPVDYTATVSSEGLNPLRGDPRPMFDRDGSQIMRIMKFDGNTYLCQVKAEGQDSWVSKSVSKEDFIRAQLLASKDTLLNNPQLSESQRAVLTAYVDVKTNGVDAATEIGQDSLNKAIQETAKAWGMPPTVDDVIANLQSQEAKVNQKNPEAVAAHKAKAEQILAIVSGQNLVNAEQMGRILSADGFSDAQIAQNAQQSRSNLERLRKEAKGSKDPRVIDALAAAEQEELAWRMAARSVSEGNAVQTLFTRMEDGDLDSSMAKNFMQAFRAADSEKMVQAVITEQARHTVMSEEDRRKHQELLKKYFRKGAVGGGILLLVLMFGSSQIIKSAQ